MIRRAITAAILVPLLVWIAIVTYLIVEWFDDEWAAEHPWH